MSPSDALGLLAGLPAAVALSIWHGRAAGDTRALAAECDPRFLQAIAPQLTGPAVASPSDRITHRSGSLARQLHPF